MLRSRSLRTMRDVWNERSRKTGQRAVGLAAKDSPGKIPSHFQGKIYKKPREWKYITKPFFKSIKEPLVDVFKEAEEMQIIIDLGNFSQGEVEAALREGKYCITGKHQDCEFYEEIPLSKNVDTKKIKKIIHNNILTLIIPRKRQK